MLYNTKFRIWSKIANWWEKQKPTCSHWFKVISPASDGRKEIEVSECVWCKQLTSEFYIKGETFDEHYKNRPYGPAEVCPQTDDPESQPDRSKEPVIHLPNRELYYERSRNVVKVDRRPRKSKKATSKAR